MSFGTAIATGFQKYSDFKGVSSRSEFWWFQLFIVLGLVGTSALNPALSTVWSVVLLVPYFASAVRRLRDAGFPWGLLFIGLVPVVGTIVVVVLWLQPTKSVGTVES